MRVEPFKNCASCANRNSEPLHILNSTPLKARKFLWLDLLRGTTAFAVFIGHVRTLYFVEYANIIPTKSAQIFYFFTGFGHQAVIIFFVLSGFFIAKTIQNSIAAKRFRFKDYFINRVIRLETVLIPALVLGFCFDSLGLKFLPDLESYAGKIISLPFASPVGKLTFETFLGNIFFVQNILTYTFGSNAPLWSLANEFWYYVLFPLLYFSFEGEYVKNYATYKPIKRFIFLAVAIGILFFVGRSITLYFFIWLMGASAFYGSEIKFVVRALPYNSYRILLFGVSILFFGVISLARLSILPPLIDDYILGFATSILVILLSECSMKSRVLKTIATYLSNISYTLYLTHVPAAMLVCGLLSNERHYWSLDNLTSFTIIIIALLIYSTAVWFLFERNTGVVKKWINRITISN